MRSDASQSVSKRTGSFSMTNGGSVAKSKYATLEAVIRAEPIHIEIQKNRPTKSAKKRGTSSQTNQSHKRFRAKAPHARNHHRPRSDVVPSRTRATAEGDPTVFN